MAELNEKHPLVTLGKPKVKIVKNVVVGQHQDYNREVVAFTAKPPIAVLTKDEKGFTCFQGKSNEFPSPNCSPLENKMEIKEKWLEDAFEYYIEYIEEYDSSYPILMLAETAKALSPENLCKAIPGDNLTHLQSPQIKPIAIAVFSEKNCVYILTEKFTHNHMKEYAINYCHKLPTPNDAIETTPIEKLKTYFSSKKETALQTFINFCFEEKTFLAAFLIEPPSKDPQNP